MAARNTSRVESNRDVSSLVMAESLPIGVERGTEKPIQSALALTSLKLPRDEHYQAGLSDGVLHLYEQGKGIGKFSLSGATKKFEVEMINGDIHISLPAHRAVQTIVLHSKPHTLRHANLVLSELGVPVSLIDEYAELHSRKSLTISELERKRELAHEIAVEFARSERARENTSRSARSRRSVTSGGESSSSRLISPG